MVRCFPKEQTHTDRQDSLQLFTVNFEAPREKRNVKRYTVPLAFGKKQKEHQYQLSLVLKDVKRLEVPVKRWCHSTKTMVPSAFYNMGIQNDYVERVNNTQTMPKGTYSRIWGYSQEPHANVPSCPKCFKRRLATVLSSAEASQENSIEDCPRLLGEEALQVVGVKDCPDCADWWSCSDNNRNGWFRKP